MALTIDKLKRWLRQIQDEYHYNAHSQEYSDSFRGGWEFNVRMRSLNIPDEVYEALSNGEIEGIINNHVAMLLEEFPEVILESGVTTAEMPPKTYLVGRGDGWLVVEDWLEYQDSEGYEFDFPALIDMIENESYSDYSDAIDLTTLAGFLDKAETELYELEKFIIKQRKALEADLSSLEWWQPILDAEGV